MQENIYFLFLKSGKQNNNNKKYKKNIWLFINL